MCLKNNLIIPATVADHIEPHHYEYYKFWFGKLQSLCKPCHDKDKRLVELRGYSNRIGVDGFPVDRNHPFYNR
jgi:hypothetical protein